MNNVGKYIELLKKRFGDTQVSKKTIEHVVCEISGIPNTGLFSITIKDTTIHLTASGGVRQKIMENTEKILQKLKEHGIVIHHLR